MRPSAIASLVPFVFLAACSESTNMSVDAGLPDAASTVTPAVAIAAPSGSLFETEPTVAASSGSVGIAWLTGFGAGRVSVGYAFSSDGGDSWGPSQVLALPDNRIASNEILAANAHGDFYLVTLGVAASRTSSGVFLSKASAGTLGAPVEVSDPAVTAMRDASAFAIARDGSLNVVWAEYQANGATHIVTARSTDDGATWTRQIVSGSQTSGAWPNVCVSRSDDRVAIVYDYGPSGPTEVVFSQDNGATWPEANRNELAIDTYAGEFPSCVVDGQDLWVVQGVAADAPTTMFAPLLDAIMVHHSADGGRNFDAPVAAQDPEAGGHSMRAMAALNADRSLSLVYYAGTADQDAQATLRRSRSTDGGKHFGPSQTLYSPLLLTTKRAGGAWLGDLLGLTADEHSNHVGFVDSSSGRAHVRYTRATP